MFQTDEYRVKFYRIGQTTCCVFSVGTKTVETSATCSDADQFNRNVGRKLALARALQNIPREKRQRVWDSYFAVRHGKW